jgi:hypothetical protein
MIVTEEEARIKWCPFVRAITGERAGSGYKLQHGLGPFNRILLQPTGEETSGGCIASACMAWNWLMDHSEPGKPPVRTDKGYCGLTYRE